ncbi:helix-turn-helix transcriptional regulator [Streptomyces sp. B-S-A8]|uniref:Helix-turn-helix transcriptional regulator n=1 Tax=Streptomyces solicavernae TaxID=3043614 RepID=A0ABT6RQ63_9ACTN|nr:helix-turn-helix transcriptional regulator [Streptomyces sp. B-S-A8]MDI3386530.1 helix-turn-helix transcriptional regulator [Streptomyces sp. B-S-A8]
MVNIKELNPDSSPAAAFGARLRRERESKGLKQEELAILMDYSSTHISAVETGRKIPTLRFSRSVDRALGTDGTADTFERQWREMQHGSLLEGFPEFVGYEGRAAEIRLYEVGVIPGLLQTPQYASALADSALKRRAISAEQARERVSVVAERQSVLDRRKNPPEIFVVLDEGCIRRPIGEPDAMDAQLAHLIAFAEQPNTTLQIAPFSMGVRRPFNLPVTVLTMADRSLMSYAESSHRGNLERESTFVVPLLKAYHQLQAESLSQAESVAMIRQLRKGTP